MARILPTAQSTDRSRDATSWHFRKGEMVVTWWCIKQQTCFWKFRIGQLPGCPPVMQSTP